MSLIQRVTSIDGPDRELNYGAGGTVKSVRRVISYDAFHPTEETPQQDHAHHHTVTAYKVSTAKRIGMFCPPSSKDWIGWLMIKCSSGCVHGVGMLAGFGLSLWLRCPQACAYRCWCLSRAVYAGGAAGRC